VRLVERGAGAIAGELGVRLVECGVGRARGRRDRRRARRAPGRGAIAGALGVRLVERGAGAIAASSRAGHQREDGRSMLRRSMTKLST